MSAETFAHALPDFGLERRVNSDKYTHCHLVRRSHVEPSERNYERMTQIHMP
jgi:hypothetical protein